MSKDPYLPRGSPRRDTYSPPGSAPPVTRVTRPAQLAPDAVSLVSQTDPDAATLSLTTEERLRHDYVIGKSGTGKTTLLKWLIAQDMAAGRGVGFIDPHGDAPYELLDHGPRHRAKDVVLFDPTAGICPPFNLLRLPYDPTKLTEDVLSAFQLFFGGSWGPRMEHLLRYGLLTLLYDSQPHTIADLRRIYTDTGYRRELGQRSPQEAIRRFWESEFPAQSAGAINPILNKFSQLLVPGSILERVFSETENELDFRDILDGGQILLVALPKGKLGAGPSELLGGFITAGIQQAALARADTPAAKRREFSLYVDEFQNYAVASFSEILAESRKYRLALTLANQRLSQLSQDLQRAALGAGTLVSFQIDYADAGVIHHEIHSRRIMARDKTNGDVFTLARFRENFLDKAVPSLYSTALGHRAGAFEAACDAHYVANDEREALLREIDDPRSSLKGWITIAWGTSDTKDQRGLASFHATPWTELLSNIADCAARLRSPDVSFSDLRHILVQPMSMDGSSVSDIFEVFEEDCPTRDELTSLEKLHAFCRMGRSDNVHRFRVPFLGKGEPESRELVINIHKSRTASRPRASEDIPTPETMSREAIPDRATPRRTDSAAAPASWRRPARPRRGGWLDDD